MKILIKVTKDILKRSAFCESKPCLNAEEYKEHKGTGFNCAIALAVRDLFPNAFVSRYDIYFPKNYLDFDKNPNMIGSKLPIEATNFIGDFDLKGAEERKNMTEFSFEIDVPMEEIDRIGIGQAYKILSESRTLELVHP